MIRLKGIEPQRTALRRKVSRRPASAAARVRSGSGDEAQGAISDLSAHGCCIRCEAGWLRLGAFVSIGIGGEAPLQAIVRWVRGGLCGLEFLRPIPAARAEWHELIDSPFFA
jgi:hypothetical protein